LDAGGALHRIWAQPAPAELSNWVAIAIPFLRQREGLELTAYHGEHDPPGVWTIGYGNTTHPDGRPVRPGDRITEAMAETYLERRVLTVEGPALARTIKGWASLTPYTQAALVSWTYNIGTDGMAGSTLVKRLNAGAPWAKVLSEELPRWHKANGEDGVLTSRRALEINLAMTGQVPPAKAPIPPRPPQKPPAAAKPAAPAGQRPVPQFYSQRDNGAQADRTCFTSSAAMLAKLVKPSALIGPNADLEHLKGVERYGDTTDAAAQVKALAGLGITARLVTTGNWDLVREQIRRTGGICLGYIHRGPITAPDTACDGHWLFCYDISATHITVHDPGGEADLVRGGFVNTTGGRAQQYSLRNFERRWMVEKRGGAWAYAPGHGWALIVDSVR
jgi:GH24 family phage-related lysozyme (muramidase)